MVARGCWDGIRDSGAVAKGYRVSFEDDKDVLKLGI